MPATSPLRLLASAVCFALLGISPLTAEDINLDNFTDVFSFSGVGTPPPGFDYSTTTGREKFFIFGDTSVTWTDTGAGIFGGTRQVTIDNYRVETGSSLDVTGQIVDNTIVYTSAATVRADVTLSYDLTGVAGGGINLTPNQYLTFGLDFEAQARESTRAQVTFYQGTTSTTAEVAFGDSVDGLNSLDLNALQTKYDWDQTTWNNIKSNITKVDFRFFSTSYGDDYSFATYAFQTEAAPGGGNIGQVPEPTSLVLLGTLIGGGLVRSPRRRRI